MTLEKFLEMRYNQGIDNNYVRFFSSKKIYVDPSIKINNEHLIDSLENIKCGRIWCMKNSKIKIQQHLL